MAQQGIVRDQVRPTLIIGLGGTGKNTLLKIRRRFFDRYGDLTRFPSIAFLYIDTDTNDLGLNKEAAGDQLIKDGTDFTNDEKVSITVVSTAPYVDSPKNTPHVAEWFYPNLRDKGDLVQGAGAIRPYGRLAFFHNYDRIHTAIDKAIQRITDQRSRELTRDNGLRVVADGTIDVFIVGSVAGGTGSGILLDTSFLIKHIAPGAKRYGFVVLPKVFGPRFASESRYANSYAALKEINHYTHRADANRVVTVGEMRSIHNFNVRWSLNEDERHIPGPPFHYLYLVDGANELGITTNHDGAYETIADAIFYEFAMSEFGSQKRSIRDNTDQYLCKVATIANEDGADVNRPQPKHYSSFGLSRITFPVDNVRGACGAILSRKVVAQWERASTNPVSPQEIEQFMQSSFLRNVGLYDNRQKLRAGRVSERDSQIVSALGSAAVEGKSLYDDLNGWIATQRQDMERLAGTRPLAALIRERFADREFKLAGWDSDFESEGRDLARQLRSNLQVKQAKITEAMNREIETLLADPARSFAYARAAVNRLYQMLTEEKSGLIDHFREERSRAEKDRLQMRKLFDAAVLELEVDGDRMTSLPVWKSMTLRYLAGRAVDAMKAYFDAHIRAAISEYSYRLAVWLEQELREENTYGLRSRLAVLGNYLTEMRGQLDAQESRYKAVPRHASQIVLFEPEDLPDIYRHLLAGKEDEWVRELARQALEQFGGNLFGLIRAVQRDGVTEVTDSLIKLCARPFGERLLTDPRFEAMRLFQRRYPVEQDQMDKLRALFDSSRAWIQFRQDMAGKEGVRLEQRSIIVGRYTPDGAGHEYYDFDQQMSRAAGADTHIRPYRTDNRNEVVIYCEVAGYPLFLMQGVGEMRESYKAARDQEAKLHIDHHQAKYGDLEPIVGEQYRQYREVVRGFVLAQALGLLKVRMHQQSGLPVFIFPVERGWGLMPRDEHLGYEDTAIERLQQRAELRKSMLEQVNRKLAQLSEQGPEAMAAFYSVLTHYVEVVYPPVLMESQGGAYEYENPIFTAVLEAEMEKIQKEWASVQAWKLAAAKCQSELRLQRQMDFVRQLAPEVVGLENRVVLNL